MARKATKENFDIEELRPAILALPIINENERLTREVIGSHGDVYAVNLVEMSCTCLDWMESRIRFPRPDVRRACKHIVWQFQLDRFVLKGEKLFGRLVPVPTLECRFGQFKINNSHVLFRCEPKRRWYFEVLAEEKGSDLSTKLTIFRTDMYRWFNRPVPKYSEPIKHYLRIWLKNQPEFEEELSPLPHFVLDNFKERERLEELDKEKCFVCRFQLSFTDKTPEVLNVCCPRCESVNVLTRSGQTNTPERLRLYRKYDGDLYDKNIEGLFSLHENSGKLAELRSTKETELNEIRRREREMSKRFTD